MAQDSSGPLVTAARFAGPASQASSLERGWFVLAASSNEIASVSAALAVDESWARVSNVNGVTPLMAALMRGHEDMVHLLWPCSDLFAVDKKVFYTSANSINYMNKSLRPYNLRNRGQRMNEISSNGGQFLRRGDRVFTM